MTEERIAEIKKNTIGGIFYGENSTVDKTLTVFCKQDEGLPLLVEFAAQEMDLPSTVVQAAINLINTSADNLKRPRVFEWPVGVIQSKHHEFHDLAYILNEDCREEFISKHPEYFPELQGKLVYFPTQKKA